MIRVARGTGAILWSRIFRSPPPAETPTAPTGLDITITDSTGAALPDPDLDDTTDVGSVGVQLTTAHTAELDTLTLSLTGTVAGQTVRWYDQIDVVERHLVTVSELRDEPNIGTDSNIPYRLLEEVRNEREAWIEQWCGIPFVPRYSQVSCRGNGRTRLYLPARGLIALRTLTINDVSIDTSLVTVDRGYLEYDGGFPAQHRVVAGIEHGLTDAPSHVARQLKNAIAYDVLRRGSHSPTDALREISPEGGTLIYSYPGPGKPMGVPAFDAILNDYWQAQIG